MLLRSVVLASALFAVPLNAVGAPLTPEQATAQLYTALRTDPERLTLFLRQFPKGADLHNHLVGAIYAESYLKWAAQDGLCVNTETNSISPNACTKPEQQSQLPATALPHNAATTTAMIDALSMRDFVPTAQDRSGHDHFFATFDKFAAVTSKHSGDSLTEALDRAANENITYLELMVSPALGQLIAAGGKHPLEGENFQAAIATLQKDLPSLLQAVKQETDDMEARANTLLQCGTPQAHPGCHVTVRYLYQTVRVLPPPAVFSQLYAGYNVVQADPRFVGLNFVAPEDNTIAMRDYDLHMRMFKTLGALYPDVKLSLHAGELVPGLVPPEGLEHHIEAAVNVAGAKRIGHGIDIIWEKNAPTLLQTMAKNNILVEINLTSNDLILNVKGKEHPFALYWRAGVPLALSTDDEGVSRADLTQDYYRAATTWPLTYQELKTLSRNGLTYAFLPGASLWQHGTLTPACTQKASMACTNFLKNSDKARLQMALENKFSAFEESVTKNRLFKNDKGFVNTTPASAP